MILSWINFGEDLITKAESTSYNTPATSGIPPVFMVENDFYDYKSLAKDFVTHESYMELKFHCPQ